MLQKLNPLEAFNAVYQLFEIYYEETGSENISTMLSCMDFDIGMWYIWMKSIDIILDEDGIENHDSLSALQAFEAIPLYLEGFYGTDLFEDIISLVADIRLAIKNESTDSEIWKKWMQCFKNVLVEDDIHYRYRVNPLFNLSNVDIKYSKNMHYFLNDRKGHLPNTLESQDLIKSILQDQANYCGVDDYGNALYIKVLSSGIRIWVYVRHIVRVANCGFVTTQEECDALIAFSKIFAVFKKRGYSYEYKIFEAKNSN